MSDEASMIMISSDEDEADAPPAAVVPPPKRPSRSPSPTLTQMLREEEEKNKKKDDIIEERTDTELDTDNERKASRDLRRIQQHKRLASLKLASDTPSCKRPRPHDRICVSCQQPWVAEYAALPCGHLLLCLECYKEKKNRCAAGDLCSRCRQVCTSMTRIFF